MLKNRSELNANKRSLRYKSAITELERASEIAVKLGASEPHIASMKKKETEELQRLYFSVDNHI